MVWDGVTYYKLYSLNESQPDNKATIKQKAASEIDHFNIEVKSLRGYKFTDLTGKSYSRLPPEEKSSS